MASAGVMMVDFEELQKLWDETQSDQVWKQFDQTWKQSDQTLCPTLAGLSAEAPLSPLPLTPPTTPQSPESGNNFWDLLSTSIYEDFFPVHQEKEWAATAVCPQSLAPHTPSSAPTPPPPLPSPLPAATQPEQKSQGSPHHQEPDGLLLKRLLEDSGENQQSQQGKNNGGPREEGKTYIKKPLNAFMLFLKEKRKLLSSEILQNGNGVVNAHLGRMWRSLSKEEQVVYFTDAEQQRLFHKMRHPKWSCKENYGKKSTQRKRKRTSTSDSGHQSKKCLTEEARGRTSVIQASHPFPWAVQPSNVQHYYMQPSYLQKPTMENIFIQIPTTNVTSIPYPTTSTLVLNPAISIPYPTMSPDGQNPTTSIPYPTMGTDVLNPTTCIPYPAANTFIQIPTH